MSSGTRTRCIGFRSLFADGEADALIGFLEAVAEFEIGRATRGDVIYVKISTTMSEKLFKPASFVRNTPQPCSTAAAK